MERVISYPVLAGSLRTRVLEAGSGDEVMLCIHGAGSRADRWAAAMPGLARLGYRVLALDLPGHGFADKRSDINYSPSVIAEYVASVLSELEVERATIVGTSYGGQVAISFALAHTGRVVDLVLVGTLGIVDLPHSSRGPLASLSDASPDAVQRKLSAVVADPDLITAALVREEACVNGSAGAAGALDAVAEYIIRDSSRDLNPEALRSVRFEHPVLMIWGEVDPITPIEMGRAANQQISGSVLKIMENCAHAPYFERPEEFVQIVGEHLRSGDFPDAEAR